MTNNETQSRALLRVASDAELLTGEDTFTPSQRLRVEEIVRRACGKCSRTLRAELEEANHFHAMAQTRLEASYAEAAVWKSLHQSAILGVEKLVEQLFSPSLFPLPPKTLEAVAALVAETAAPAATASTTEGAE